MEKKNQPNFEISMYVFKREFMRIMQNEPATSAFESVRKMVIDIQADSHCEKNLRVTFSMPWGNQEEARASIRDLYSAAVFAGWIEGRSETAEIARDIFKNISK